MKSINVTDKSNANSNSNPSGDSSGNSNVNSNGNWSGISTDNTSLNNLTAKYEVRATSSSLSGTIIANNTSKNTNNSTGSNCNNNTDSKQSSENELKKNTNKNTGSNSNKNTSSKPGTWGKIFMGDNWQTLKTGISPVRVLWYTSIKQQFKLINKLPDKHKGIIQSLTEKNSQKQFIVWFIFVCLINIFV